MNFLLLRGLVREQRHWTEFPRVLAETMPGAKVTMLDLPGTGTENGRESPATIPEIATDLRSRFQTNGEPWTIVGVSLGGMVTLEWCARWPGDFQRAVVINTSSGDLSRPWERLDWKNYATVAYAAASSDHGVRERAIVQMTINRSDFDKEELVDRWITIARDRPVSKKTLFRQITAATKSKLPQKTGVPTLVLASKADRLVRAVCSERIAKKLQTPLAMHETAGHDLPFDDAPWCAKNIREFLHRA